MNKEAKVNPENKPGKFVSFRRILVPLDESEHSHAALKAAAQIASALGSEISGLYVEDTDLLELSRFPFAREIGIYRSRRLDQSEIERDFRIQAERIRRTMAFVAKNTDISWNFTVRRGRVMSEILNQTASADLTVIGRLGRSLLGTSAGSTVRHLIEEGKAMTLILGRGTGLAAPVLTVYTASELSARALGVAVDLARALKGEAEVLIPAQEEKDYREMRGQVLEAAEEIAGSRKMRIRFRRIKGDKLAAMAAILRPEYRKPLVLPIDALERDSQAILKLINRVHNPILLVR